MPGHVFVLPGNITKLACDAWLLPSDTERIVEQRWFAPPPPLREGGFDEIEKWGRKVWRLRGDPPAGWLEERVRVTRLPVQRPGPQPWLAHVSGSSRTEVEWYLRAADEFVDRASGGARWLRERACPLLAVPVIGTGEGGAAKHKGLVLGPLLERLQARARAAKVDVALVTHGMAALAAAQVCRRKGAYFSDLPPEMREVADHLATRARRGDLVVFLGAGVSQGAGLPGWKQLLRDLARDLTRDQRRALDQMLAHGSPLDAAQVIENLRGGSPLRASVAERLKRHGHYAVAHALLAALPSSEFVTMNYDRLFEDAWDAAHAPAQEDELPRPLSVLPYEPRGSEPTWLLKMHGCVSHPDDIVLTRQDYLRYVGRRGALQGIVQALLLTRHMLFVGFSLTDDNFHALVDEVRRAWGETEPRKEHFGTALVGQDDLALRALWDRDIRPIAPPASPDGPSRPAESFRQIDVFLDYLAFRSGTGAAHFFDHTFDHTLHDEERDLRDALERLRDEFRPRFAGDADSPAWRAVETLFARLGDRSRPPAAVSSQAAHPSGGDR